MSEANSPARIVLADDHELARMSLKALLRGERDLQVVGEAPDGRGAIDLFRRLRPDLLLVDAHMPDVGGVEVARTIKAAVPTVRVVVVSMENGPSGLLAALDAGADGYLVKGTPRADALRLVRQVLAGVPHLLQTVAVDLVAVAERDPRAWPISFRRPLTAVEQDIVRRFARGQLASQIGAALGVDSTTVTRSWRQVLDKLGLNHALR